MEFDEKLRLFQGGALEALLWLNDYSRLNVDPDSEAKLDAFCERFVRLFEWELDALANFERSFQRYSHYGHDFIMSWCGVGVGYWEMFCDHDNYYDQTTVDLLSWPLELAVRGARGSGELHVYADNDASGDEVAFFQLPDWPEHITRLWLDEAMKKWMPGFPEFVTRHLPSRLRVPFVKIMRKFNNLKDRA